MRDNGTSTKARLGSTQQVMCKAAYLESVSTSEQFVKVYNCHYNHCKEVKDESERRMSIDPRSAITR